MVDGFMLQQKKIMILPNINCKTEYDCTNQKIFLIMFLVDGRQDGSCICFDVLSVMTIFSSSNKGK